MGTVKVKIVEDDEDLRELLTVFLSSEGFLVSTAMDGCEALHQLEQESGWVVLTDTMMPNMDGFELIERLQRSQRLRGENPVILFSAGCESRRISSLLEKHAIQMFVPKPFDIDELMARIRSVWQWQEQTRGSTALTVDAEDAVSSPKPSLSEEDETGYEAVAISHHATWKMSA
jgi:DNA-binding response OmpR family regulator